MSQAVYQKITDYVTDRMSQGQIPWRKTWSVSQFAPQNYVTKHNYTGVNLFLAWVSGKDPRFMSAKQIADKGGNIRKGSKSIPIVYFKQFQVQDIKDPEKMRMVPMIRYYNVFSVEDVEGIEIPKLEVKERDFKPIDACENLFEHQPMSNLTFNHGGDRAAYSPAMDSIIMPEKTRFDSPEAYYATLFHEMGHATGHESRLNRDLKGLFGDHSYSQEELVAEMTAAFLCAETGIDQPIIENTVAYIQSWMKRIKQDQKLFVKAAAQAQKAADLILNRKKAEQAA